ncbi:KGK domain-containing protein [Spirulina sp. 06S082]|uniref:KGK domain-containing protein n=1 Tax=Spirulina sp. 06S082 TaxID=3110248 RepID=UPI002B216ECA|nr:KGK domain-containing protein [Spirulina sp. 06S082]MEA5471796.1 KGK domain-containing protein [Spirulina sp. 06S082]
MGKNSRQEGFDDNDVIAFGDDAFKIGKFKQALQKCFGYDFGYGLLGLLGNQGIKIDKTNVSPDGEQSDFLKWFNEGVECEILKTDAKGWRNAKVKIKVSVEFVVDESPLSSQEQTSPLDSFSDLDVDESDATVIMYGDRS